jgi:hypothetical protein
MNKARIIALIFCCIFLSCSSDYSEELSGNYYYVDEGGETKVILSHLPGKTNILGKVVSYNSNKDFIVALQQPSFKNYRDAIAFDLREEEGNTELGVIESQELADSVLKYDPYYVQLFSNRFNYWIISHSENKTYGPLTVKEYLTKRKELHVPSDFRIR